MAPAITRILVPTDFSATADAALAYAKTVARRSGASLHLVHVIEAPSEAPGCVPDVNAPTRTRGWERVWRDARANLLARLPQDEERHLGTIVVGQVAKQIVTYAADQAIDCVVMGTHGSHSVARQSFSSVADQVARRACCPVLTVHGTHRGVTLKAPRPTGAVTHVVSTLAAARAVEIEVPRRTATSMSESVVEKTVFWHRELPPPAAEVLEEHVIEAVSARVSGTLAHRDELWQRCYEDLMNQTTRRLEQEVARLHGRYAHVLSESVDSRHDDAYGEAWLHGRFTYMLYRGGPIA